MRTLLTTILLLLAAPAVAQPVPDAAPLAATVSVPDPEPDATPSPRGSTPCVVDWNADGSVNVLDVVAFITAWNAAGPGADFNTDGGINVLDVVAFISAWNSGCDEEPEIIVLRDSIGPDSSTTHGNQVFGMSTSLSGIDAWLGVEASANPGSILKEVSFVVAPSSGFADLDWNNQNFRLRIWNNSAEAISSPIVPTVRQIELVGPSSEPPIFGQVFHPFFTLVPSYLLTFDVSSEDVQFPSSGNLFIGITMVEGGAPERPAGIPETTEAGSTDIGWNSPQGVVYVSNSTLSQYDGRIAVRVSVID